MSFSKSSLPVWMAVSSLALGSAALAESNTGATDRRATEKEVADQNDTADNAVMKDMNDAPMAQKNTANEAAAMKQIQMIAREGNKDAGDQLFVLHCATGNLWEARLSELVAQRSNDKQVKELAQQIMRDHEQANQKLRPIAESLKLTLGDQLPAIKEAELEVYRNMPVADLEKCYLVAQKAMHAQVITAFADHAQLAKNLQLREYVTAALPTLREHAQHIVTVAEAKGINGGLMMSDAKGDQPAAGADTGGAIQR